jgi:putative membrane protein
MDEPLIGLDVATRLSVERTRLAYDRTMMAWVRTSSSMITFGFSVYKFFQIETDVSGRTARLVGPREFSILLVGLGLAALLVSTVEYRGNLRALKAEFPQMARSRMTTVVAVSLSILGALALIAVLLRK